jgi:hypothetical protein
MTNHLRKRVSGCLSLLILFMLVHAHFLGDPCLLHGEHTAQAMLSTLSSRAMTCLCFFHAVYAPVEVRFAAFSLVAGLTREPVSGRNIRLLTLEIFHPPRG